MVDAHPTDLQVLEVIIRSPDKELEEIVLDCPGLTWNQVFLAIDRLTREGVIQVAPKGPGIYTVHLASEAQAAALRRVFV